MATHQSTRSNRASLASDVVRSVGLSRRRPIGFWRRGTSGGGTTIRRVTLGSVGWLHCGGRILNHMSCLSIFHSRNWYDLTIFEKFCVRPIPARSALVSTDDRSRQRRALLVTCNHCIKDAVENQVEFERASLSFRADWNCWSRSLDQPSSGDMRPRASCSSVGGRVEMRFPQG